MSMHSLLRNNTQPECAEIEKNFDGNLCRCTGYRAILDAMKTCSVDSKSLNLEKLELEDIEDLNCSKMCKQKLHLINKRAEEWFEPKNLEDFYSIMHRSPHAKFISGNTATCVYKTLETPNSSHTINISTIKELHVIEAAPDHLTLGSALTLTKIIQVFKNYSTQKGFCHLSTLTNSIEKVANIHVRNVATWSGNYV